MLIIFQACQAKFEQGESSVRSGWTQQPPVLGDVVSMGIEREWSIVKLTEFEPIAEFQVVDRVVLAHVSPIGVRPAPAAQWTCEQMREFAPLQSLDVALSAVRSPSLEISYSTGGLPIVGQIYNDEVTGSGTVKSTPAGWIVNQVEKYQPVGESAYTAVHLCWCVPMKAAIAA